ncbi:MAG: hypothetical protein A2Y03_00470 [Omnitrophica WOR_2 bacterium GWF2_38_59]|nr:MAG: hypothetical protein A2Y03_00470 [Omnitrophica WOR_2 bacterium GWF2_38_59]OGX47742.1 MAG: hypothetical protein A2243_00360 [Omnitrophica WOR_2 bacterium RIFOXYA2_FULL_38_17]OGX50432.1 MAG: hypothetical protein A2267_09275 [Omnitrophica WOR_2 bacterium RIFOXYA12_FULL_38_10]OGX55781.1 MAG: hypothetical protein A2306_11050 [Omnitrophica WOR_2 bacterium RIFOXYB2_FULL_38_16]HBG60377.1 bifunctional 5,10-methylene-tetrahydrofolate dehydrogenase/5,10-methylene-tetrahydrofolate cyclohydrolase [C
MSARVLNGKILASKVKDSLKSEVEKLKKEFNKVPKMVNIVIGQDHGTCAYAKSQEKVAEYIGINYELKTIPADVRQEKLEDLVCALNNDAGVNGIMIHKPVPDQINYNLVANHIDIIKDLEGINIANIGKMVLGETKIVPCTPASIMEHIKSTGVNLRGKEAVIVGSSSIVGKPLCLLLLREFATVTVCHIGTSEAGKLEGHVKNADILIVAVGIASLIKGDMIKKGAIVIDVGINRSENGIVGDVEYDSAKEKASYITPVPGGVGPVTVVMLMKNAIEAFKAQL